ncbi:putative ribonuclease H-like domain-containing protein [Tanacetum coccineum]
MDDLYYNFKIVEQKAKKSVGASSGAQNLAFMTAPRTSSTNYANTLVHKLVTTSLIVNAGDTKKFKEGVQFRKIKINTRKQETKKKNLQKAMLLVMIKILYWSDDGRQNKFQTNRPKAFFHDSEGQATKDENRICRHGSQGTTGNIAYHSISDLIELYDCILRRSIWWTICTAFDMKNIVPKESLTCLVAKATLDETMLWHRRLRHINFQNINKLAKDNLVRGLPTKHFENDQTCVAYLKGKQHRASCLTWYYLLTKDETSEIFKNFIKEIENLVDKKVKIIKSDNGTEFKNKVMDDFCREKGIKRKYSVSRTPQQNGVVERRNKTLIEAARTMDTTLNQEGKENLHIEFLEKKPMIEDNVISEKKSVSRLALCANLKDTSYFDLPTKDVENGEPKTADDAQKQVEDSPNNENIELTSIAKALSDSSWVEAMQEELLQFKLQQVWILVDLPSGKRAIGGSSETRKMKGGFAFLYVTIEEEVYLTQPPGFKDLDHPNKVYKVVKELYGLHQAPRAWYETLANYLLGNGFKRGKIDQILFIKKQKGDILLVQIYVDDIIFGSTNKELCTGFEKLIKDKFQKSSMGELTLFLGLQVQQKEDGIFISQDKYVAEILKKFNYTDVKSASTPVDLEKPLVKDGDADDVDVHLYRSMIRDSPFELVAYTDSDYAGATQDRKSTTRDLLTKGFDAGRFQYLVSREATYLYTQSMDGRICYIKSIKGIKTHLGISKEVGTPRYLSLVVPLTKVGDEAVHKELGDRMERAATTASSLEAEQDSGSGPRCQDTILGDVNAQTRFEITSKQSIDPPLSRGYTLGSGEDSMKLIGIDEILLKLVLSVFVSAVKRMLMLPVQVSAVEVNPVIYTSCIEQFWATAKVQTVNGVRQLQALVDKKRVIVTESSIRRDLHLDDAEGTDCLPTATIFEELARMGYEKPSQKLTFYKAFFSPQWKYYIHTITQCLSAKSTAWNEFSSSMASLIICLATNQKFNLSKYIFDAMVKHLDGGVKFLMYLQVPQDETEHKESVPTPSNDPQPSGEKRIQRLERNKMSRPTGLKRRKKVGMSRRVESFEDQESLGDPEDASKQGRSIADLDKDDDVTLVDETQERQDDELMFDTGVLDANEMLVEAKLMRKINSVLSLMIVLLVKQTSSIKAAKPKVVTTAATTTTTRLKARRVVVQKPSEFRAPQEAQPSISKDKGKGIMIEPEVPLKIKDQIALDEQIARDIQTKLDAELIEEQKLVRKQEEEANIALIES